MNRAFKTQIDAISPETGELTRYSGTTVFAINADEAQKFCDDMFPYMKVTREDKQLFDIAKKLC